MKSKNPVGRPVERIIPYVPDTPENVAKTILKTPPKKGWRFKNKSNRLNEEK